MSPRLAIALPNRDPLKTAKKIILARFGMRQDEHEHDLSRRDRIFSRHETESLHGLRQDLLLTKNRERGSTKGM